MDELRIQLALSIAGVSWKNLAALQKFYGSQPKDWVSVLQKKTQAVKLLGEKRAEALLSVKTANAVEDSLLWESHYPNAQLISIWDERYSFWLSKISVPPLLLWGWGDASLLKQPALGVVGTRRATHSAKKNAFSFSKEAAKLGWVVVSGLALGVDREAHLGALSAGKTIAVLGSGFLRPYPKDNIPVFERIKDEALLLSEMPLNMPPMAQNFPRRNRIISGLSRGVLIVEAPMKSGTLITAHQALEQNRELMVIPDSIHNPMAEGSNQLIAQGAPSVYNLESFRETLDSWSVSLTREELPFLTSKPLETNLLESKIQSDILKEELGDCQETENPSIKKESLAPISLKEKVKLSSGLELNEEQLLLLEHIDFQPTTVDEIAFRLGKATHEVALLLLRLESFGLIEAQGASYLRVVLN